MTEETLFELIRQTPAAERPDLLDRECGGDPELRRRVEQLLAAHEAPKAFLSPLELAQPNDTGALDPESPPVSREAETASEGALLAGKYRLLMKIGEGGMGTVWLAEQDAPLKRKVAIKLIKPGMDSRQILARFETERQALAVMEHPNIAKVLDGGATADGRPYFVMELVKGVPITEYCDANRLTPRQRLELFIPVCQAIQHAHQKGVIHRDIKPSNVLIALYDEKPVPKVIDFGLAKATGQALTENTLSTALGAVVGTPQYMSPEQATLNNLDIDTRSDVYSLGVLLYELLTGSPPFSKNELEKKGLLEILRVVREEEPPKPSTKLSSAEAMASISANRNTEPKKLTSILRNDLDWILLKTLEKDRSRRYETANGFASDLMRYLSGESVLAHPPSRSYRLMKFLRKNRGPVLAATVLAATLIVGIVGTSLGLIRADRARVEEAKQRQLAEENAGQAVKNAATAAANAKAAEDATSIAREAERRADTERRSALAVAASSTLDQAQQICENGDVVRGLHLMASTLAQAIESGDRNVEEAIRWNIAAWLPHVHRMRGFIPLSNGRTYRACCISPDGKIIIGGTLEGELIFLDGRTVQPIRKPESIGKQIMKVAWQPGGEIIAILCKDGTLRLWKYSAPFRDAKVIPVGPEMNGPFGGLAFSKDGTKVLVGASGSSALLFHAETGERAGPGFYHGSTYADAVAISPDGTKVVIGTPNWSVRVYELSSGKPLSPVIRTYGPNCCAGISPDGTKFFTGHLHDGSVQVWDINTGATVGPRISTGAVLCGAFSSDGKRILVGGWIRYLQEWDYHSGKPVGSPIPRSANDAVYTPDGRSIVTVFDGLGVWDIPSRGVVWTGDRLPGSPHGFTMRADSKELALTMSDSQTRDSDGTQTKFLRRYDVATGNLIQPILPTQKHARSSPQVFLPPDGRTAYAVEGEGLTEFDLVRGQEIGRLIPPKLPGPRNPPFDSSVYFAMSDDGKYLVYARDHLQIYSINTKQWVTRHTPDNYKHHKIGFLPNTHTVYLYTTGKLYLSDLDNPADGIRIVLDSKLGNSFGGAAVRPDGHAIALMASGNLMEFDLRTFRSTGFSLGTIITSTFGYSMDGRVLYGKDDIGVAAWHPPTHKKLGPYFTQGDGRLRGILPDGNALIVLTDDRRLQRVETTKPLSGTPDEVTRRVIEATGFSRYQGNIYRIAPPKRSSDWIKVFPPLPVAEFREIHNVEILELTKWFAAMPKNFRPSHLTVQEGSNGKRFDAIAVDDGSAGSIEAHLALSAKKGEVHQGEADAKAMGSRPAFSKTLLTTYFVDGVYHVHHVWMTGAKREEFWKVKRTPEEVLAAMRNKRKKPSAIGGYDNLWVVTAEPDEGHAWEFHIDLTAEQVKQKVDECRKRNWRPTMVHRHRTDADKFAITLIDNPHEEPWEFQTGLSLAEYEKKLAEYKARGWRPEYVHSWIVDQAPVYTVVWVGNLQQEPK